MGRSGSAGRRRDTSADVTFALVGPEQTDVSQLKALPNVHLLGQRPHAELPRYVTGFDVGLVPYRITEYTANVYPTKLNEYLVMGIPVVATDLVEIRRFNAEHGEIVRIAESGDAYANAVKEAVVDGAAAVRRRRAASRWRSRTAGSAASRRCRRSIDAELSARQARTTGWEDRLRQLYRAAQGRPREDRRGCARPVSSDLLQPAGVVARRAAAHRRAAATGRRHGRVRRRRRRVGARRRRRAGAHWQSGGAVPAPAWRRA